MTTYNQVMAVAKSHLDHHGSHARAYCHLGNGQPYCCAFVRMCTSKAGGAKLFYDGKMVTYCPNAIRWCKANLAEVPMYLAMPMDFIFFDWQPNGTPDHIGFVFEKISADRIKTLEGNTSGGKVAIKTRSGYVQGIFRPHYTPNKKLSKSKLKVDGDFGYHSIYMMQAALGLKADGILKKSDVKALQKKVGAVADGAWGRKTSLKVQAWVGAKKDGEFGENSVRALQKKLNAINYPSSAKPATTKKTPISKPKTVAIIKPSKQAENAVKWAKNVAKKGGYTYKHWNNKDKESKLCPICHTSLKGKYKGWNCIGFVTASYHHGAGLKNIKCSCSGMGTDSFFTKVTLTSWTKRNGKGWKMITNGGSKGGADISASKLIAGDVVICYDSKGKFHHVVLFTGNGRYIDCTNTSKKHIAERKYSDLCKRYHCTRAFRFVG